MKSNAQILQEILACAKSELLKGSDMGYTMPDGKYHIFIYADQETQWNDSAADTFYVIEPNKVVNGAHEPMGDTFITSSRDISEVIIGCQWCMEWFEADRAKEVSKDTELPDELIVRMAHEAGWMEAEGRIEFHSWEELQKAIRDAIEQYFNEPNERNPFSIEEALEKILLDQYPSEPSPSKSIYREAFILTCTEEHDYGINTYVSLHNSFKEALEHSEVVRKQEDVDDAYWNYDVSSEVMDIAKLPEPSPEKLAEYLLQSSSAQQTKPSLTDQIQVADVKRSVTDKADIQHRNIKHISSSRAGE